MSIDFKNSFYLEVLKQNKNFSCDVKISEQVKNQLLFKYGEVEKHQFNLKYSTEGWLGRKITALPKAIWFGVVQPIYHLALGILIGIPYVYRGKREYLKAQLFNVARDLQCAFGNLASLINDRYGQFHIQESQFQKTCYDFFLTDGLNKKEKVTPLSPLKKEKLIILDSAVGDGKSIQGLESEAFLMGAEHSQKVKAEPIKSDYASKDCVDLASQTAECSIIPLEVAVDLNEYLKKWCSDNHLPTEVSALLISNNIKSLEDLIALTEEPISSLTDVLKSHSKDQFLKALEGLKQPSSKMIIQELPLISSEDSAFTEEKVIIQSEMIIDLNEDFKKWCSDHHLTTEVSTLLISNNIKSVEDLIALTEEQISSLINMLKPLPKKRFLIELQALKQPPSQTISQNPPTKSLPNKLTVNLKVNSSKEKVNSSKEEDAEGFVGVFPTDEELSLEELQMEARNHMLALTTLQGIVLKDASAKNKLSKVTVDSFYKVIEKHQDRACLLVDLIKKKGGVFNFFDHINEKGKETREKEERIKMPKVKFSPHVQRFLIERTFDGSFVTTKI